MRNCGELFSDVRSNTGIANDNRFSDAKLFVLINQAMREIRRVIFLSNPTNCPFCVVKVVPLVSGQEAYDLPSDIFAVSSIVDVKLTFNNTGIGVYTSRSLRRLSVAERAREGGYTIIDHQLYLSPMSDSSVYNSMLMTYLPVHSALEVLSDEPDLPDVCEEYITWYMERRIQAINSSTDVGMTTSFTEEQRNAIGMLFADTGSDPIFPPIQDDTYINY
jgi:hypothetical protein